MGPSSNALAFEGFIDGLTVDRICLAPLVQIGATGDEGRSDGIIKIIAASNNNGNTMPDSVYHKVNNTPNQVLDKSPDGWLVVALKAAIKARRVSMRDLSDRLSIPYRSLQNYLSGESRIPADVLLRICAEIGLEADYLLKGSFEVSHGDLYDAVIQVFKDVLPSIEIGPGSRLRLKDEPSKDRSETLTVAHVLAVRLNEAYAHYREVSFKGGSSRPQSSTTVKNRQRSKTAN